MVVIWAYEKIIGKTEIDVRQSFLLVPTPQSITDAETKACLAAEDLYRLHETLWFAPGLKASHLSLFNQLKGIAVLT